MEEEQTQPAVPGFLLKAAAFIVVQFLVYFVLFKSSTVFSTDGKVRRSLSFRPNRPAGVQRSLAGDGGLRGD
ncbi:hypothetical protein HPP92_024543 [Vanilla planifolia]|uniref:Uncharacterized protein n=1 Tax=Vanilla planifolia TaxID=51239 RepID=A0A835PMK5_VANPL|nr:hypothetical protein HPP92_024791 [Vanilla planifolia]KAG0456755.1 hypothetical protein HPP92_024543 [Vanilla planifolia]